MSIPRLLTIAGSDPCGGAGIQADLKTFLALDTYGMAVITAITAQSTRGVAASHPLDAGLVAEQLDTLLLDISPDAVKVGMLGSTEIASVVAQRLAGPLAGTPSVLDPVMVSSSGARLLSDPVSALRELLPLVDVVTPNLDEAAALTRTAVARTVPEMINQAEQVAALGACRVLVKGGHLSQESAAVDVWWDESGPRLLESPRIPTRHTHGTGCTLSSAIAALRPRRPSWDHAVSDAKTWLIDTIRGADGLQVGQGSGPLDHGIHLRGSLHPDR